MRFEEIGSSLRTVLASTVRYLLQASLVLVLFFGGWKDVADATVVHDPKYSQDRLCYASAVWHEARGEPRNGRRSVIDTIYNRAVVLGISACEVVAQPRQFAWYKRKGLVRLTDEEIAVYNSAIEHPAVLTDEKYRWFYSGTRPVWAKEMNCRAIGNHKFCKERS